MQNKLGLAYECFPEPRQEALSATTQVLQNLQQEQGQSQLQLHAQC